ncbi:hypothetical protein OBBRIDRAFT_886301, partial [Obba rivulosa]
MMRDASNPIDSDTSTDSTSSMFFESYASDASDSDSSSLASIHEDPQQIVPDEPADAQPGLHRALQIEDILHIIFDCVTNGQNVLDAVRWAEKTWMARAARTCKAFSKPALDILWREMDDLRPWLRLISNVECVNIAGYPSEKYFMFSNKIRPSEWTRFKTYSRRIQRLSYTYRSYRLDENLLTTLAKRNGGEPLLPALQELAWLRAAPYDVDTSLNLIPSCLCKFELSFSIEYVDDSTEEQLASCFDTFLRELSAKAPKLQKVRADFPKESEVYRRWERDRGEARTVLISTQTLEMLSQLSNLTDLDLSTGIRRSLEASPFNFPYLSRLRFCGPLAAAERLIRVLLVPALIEVELIGTEGEEDEYTRTLFLTCSQFGATLQRIELKLSMTDDLSTTRSVLDVITPLLKLHDLRSVDLDFPFWRLTLCDEDVRAIGEAWPQLEQLRIDGSMRNSPSIDSLVCIATLCPMLTILTLPSIDPACTLLPAGHTDSSHNLKFLFVLSPNHPEWSDTITTEVAQALYHHFPYIDLDLYNSSVFLGCWGRVMARYFEMQGSLNANVNDPS